MFGPPTSNETLHASTFRIFYWLAVRFVDPLAGMAFMTVMIVASRPLSLLMCSALRRFGLPFTKQTVSTGTSNQKQVNLTANQLNILNVES